MSDDAVHLKHNFLYQFYLHLKKEKKEKELTGATVCLSTFAKVPWGPRPPVGVFLPAPDLPVDNP